MSLFTETDKVKAVFLRRVKGGPGSGNFGHAGRPGTRGGSSPNSDNISSLSLSTVLDNLRSVGYDVRNRPWGQWVSPDGKGISPTNERGIVNHWELAVDGGWLSREELNNLQYSPNEIVNGLIKKGWLRFVGNGFATWELTRDHQGVIEDYASHRQKSDYIYLDIVGEGMTYRIKVQDLVDNDFNLRKTMMFSESREYTPSPPLDLDAVAMERSYE